MTSAKNDSVASDGPVQECRGPNPARPDLQTLAIALGKAHSYEVVRRLGRGSYGAVFLAHNKNGRRCAVKVVAVGNQKEQVKRKKRWTSALVEARMLACLQHPYIIRYWNSFCDDEVLAIVMDYSNGGNLAQKITRLREAGDCSPEITVIRWFTQAALGLKHVHSKRIIHCDMKSQNMLLTKDGGTLRIADFGAARNLGTEDAICEGITVGTPHYLSPEVCTSCRYSFASDVWALGIVLYEMTALKVPFDANGIHSLAKKILKGPMPPLSETYSDDLHMLSEAMNQFHYDQRPTCADIVQRAVVQADIRRLIWEEDRKSAACSVECAESRSRSPPPPEARKATNTECELTALPSSLSGEDLSRTSIAGATVPSKSTPPPSPSPPAVLPTAACAPPVPPPARSSRSPSPVAKPMEARPLLAAHPRHLAPLQRGSSNLVEVPSASFRNTCLLEGKRDLHPLSVMGPPKIPTLDLGEGAAVPAANTSRHSYGDLSGDREGRTCAQQLAASPSSSRSFSTRLRHAVSIPRVRVIPPSIEQDGPAAASSRRSIAAVLGRSASAAAVGTTSRGEHDGRALRRPSRLPPLGLGLPARDHSRGPTGFNSSRDAEVGMQSPSARERLDAPEGVSIQGLRNVRLSQHAGHTTENGPRSTRERRRPPCPCVVHDRNRSENIFRDRHNYMRQAPSQAQDR